MTDKTELRGLCPLELAQALDAIAMSKGLDRNAYVVKVLDEHVRVLLREDIVRARALRGNPMLTECNRND